MKIGIIGAGHIGGALTRRLAKLGHDVSVANSRGPETLDKLAKETGAKAVTVAGSLDESWRQQPGSPVYGTDYDAAGVRRALASAGPERPADFRAKD